MIPGSSSTFFKALTTARQDNVKKDHQKTVEYIIEDALEALAEHYIEDYLIDFHVGDGHDEESPIYEWLPQDILKSILEHYIIEPGVKYAIHFTDNDE